MEQHLRFLSDINVFILKTKTNNSTSKSSIYNKLFLSYSNYLLFFLFFIFINLTVKSQTPGLIFEPTNTVTTLDPNADNFTSATESGFVANDLAESEIGFFAIPVTYSEPTSDLRRGSDCNVTDIVPDASNVGAYMYFDGTNMIFRMRMGGYTKGSFGYSILIDADQKLGNSGPDADPTYFAQTTGSNGNPGFEYEIVWEKNFRLAIYNVNNTGTTPVFMQDFSEASNTQASKCLSENCSNSDYYMDFFIPISALNISGLEVTASTPIRFCITTSMSPAPSIGGTKSDIYGVNDDNYPVIEDAWTDIIKSQKAFTPNDIGSGGSGVGAVCTSAPKVNGPIENEATSVYGSWTSSSDQTSATITVYKNGSSIGTTTASSGISWTLSGISPILSTNDIIYAKAQAAGESQCLQSNEITVSACTPANQTAIPTDSCFSQRGASGRKASGSTINIYVVNSTGISSSEPYLTTNLTYPTSTSWAWESTNQSGTGICSGGPTDVLNGTYFFTATQTGLCESKNSRYICIGHTVTTVEPKISQSTLSPKSTIVSGTATSGVTVFLWINGENYGSTTATGGNYSFSGLTLELDDEVEVSAQAASECMSTLVSRTVNCISSIPIITTGSDGNIANGSFISGTSAEADGATVFIFNATTNSNLGSATVSNGIWTSGVTASIGSSYYAKQISSCDSSDASATASTLADNSTTCPAISTPISETATIVSGSLSSAATDRTVRLYQDGAEIGSTLTSTTSWSINIVSPYQLYPGGSLVATTQQIGTNIESSCNQNILVSCEAPTIPLLSDGTFTICSGENISTDVTNSISDVIYTIENTSGTEYEGVSKMGTGGSITLTSNSYTADKTLKVYASKIGNYTCESASSDISVGINDVTAGTVAGDQEIGIGDDPAAFTVETISSGSGSISYQWQSSTTSSSSGFLNIQDANSDTYDPPSGITETTYYKRISTSTLSGVACDSESNVLTVTYNESLPVELIDFRVVPSDGSAELYWITASFSNFNYFEVEQSSNAIDFNTIGKVIPDNSTILTTSSFDFIDINPENSINYYRLKMVDLDGSYKYSEIITADFSLKDKNIIIYPNPAQNEINVIFKTTLNDKSRIEILNSAGIIILKKDIKANTKNCTINTSNYSDGIYYIRIISPNETLNEEILIIH